MVLDMDADRALTPTHLRVGPAVAPPISLVLGTGKTGRRLQPRVGWSSHGTSKHGTRPVPHWKPAAHRAWRTRGVAPRYSSLLHTPACCPATVARLDAALHTVTRAGCQIGACQDAVVRETLVCVRHWLACCAYGVHLRPVDDDTRRMYVYTARRLLDATAGQQPSSHNEPRQNACRVHRPS